MDTGVNCFERRRFFVWFAPFALVLLFLPLVLFLEAGWNLTAAQVLALVVGAAWTIALVQIERRLPRFRHWMWRYWGERA